MSLYGCPSILLWWLASPRGNLPREKGQWKPHVVHDPGNHALSFFQCPLGHTDELYLGWKDTPVSTNARKSAILGFACRMAALSSKPLISPSCQTKSSLCSRPVLHLSAVHVLERDQELFKQILKTRDSLKFFLYWKKLLEFPVFLMRNDFLFRGISGQN